MTEHTPGPWEYVVDTWHNNELYIVAADAPQDHIGEIYSSEEDARLSSTSPELLEALKNLLAEAVEFDDGREWIQAGINPETVRQARAAIAKAKGESQ